MTDAERLSRLLDGDLPDAEADALHARIEAEPALARQWAAMQALPGALAALGDAGAPPPLALRAPAPAPKARAWLPVAAAAVLGLGLGALTAALARPAAPTLVLQAGVQSVEGDILVRAGTHRVAVDGRATITVEPRGAAARATGPSEEDPMDIRTAALSAAAGAAVTVAVYEGTAVISRPEGPATTVSAGETVRVGGAAAPGPRVVRREVATGDDPTALAARVADLEAENDRLRLQATLAEGQLTAHVGVPQAWPDDVPRGLAPGEFSAWVRAGADGVDDAAIVDIDCTEYPCLAILEATGDPSGWDGWEDRAKSVHEGLEASGFEGPAAVSGYAARALDDQTGAERLLYAFAVLPGVEAEGPAARRLETRAAGALRDTLSEPPSASMPEDVREALQTVGYIEP